MCGRFNVIDNPGLQQLLKDLGIDLQLPRAINIAPTEQVSLIRGRSGSSQGVELVSARWWLTPSWAKQVDQKYAMFNARSESLSARSAYKKPFRSQRGVIAMSSFIEWQTLSGVKQPYDISTESGAMAAAALWDVWEGGGDSMLSCTLVTTAAAQSFSPWHSRMPVLLTASECVRWLDNTQTIADNDKIFRSEFKERWHLAPLDKAIGNSRLKTPELLEPAGEIVVLAA
ncbi:MAG: putative SOS response-associated peptidase YedK [Halioglobus sp.]|jgi:putative SOS response-associated peptidase YedK